MYPEDEPEIADIIRRRLEKEVQEAEMSRKGQQLHEAFAQSEFVRGYNQCRRDIGLRDVEET